MSHPSTDDKDFIIRIIQYLETAHDITFFITPKDFDCLYNWWEKRIPLKIIFQAISAVVERWQVKRKMITCFSSFKYEVKKSFEAFMQLYVGGDMGAGDKNVVTEPHDPFRELQLFADSFPSSLIVLKEDFEALFLSLKNTRTAEPELFYRKLTDLFVGDAELDLKTTIFLKHLVPELRKPEIEQRYRLNFLLNKFHIPDFQVF